MLPVTITPDIAGYRDAQRRLRDHFGRSVRFYGPAAMVWDTSLAPGEFDPETGLPFDPVITGSAQASANVAIPDLTLIGSAQADVVFQPLTAIRRDELAEDQLGIRSRLNKDLILDINDLPVASGATYFQVGTASGDSWVADDDELWKIVNLKTDGVGGLQRVIVFGQGTE